MIGHPLKVRELLDEIERGEVLLPEIQRAYVWKGPQVAKLIDSLYREYPSGQVLLWAARAANCLGAREFGGVVPLPWSPPCQARAALEAPDNNIAGGPFWSSR